MRGRVAYYKQEHLLVLNIIRELKEQQNLPLEVIKQLLGIRAQHGRYSDEPGSQATPVAATHFWRPGCAAHKRRGDAANGGDGRAD